MRIPVAFLLCLFGVPAMAQEPPAPPPASTTQPAPTRAEDDLDYEALKLDRVAEAVRTEGAMILDGRLDEPSWRNAPVITGFIQRDPATGRQSTERTEVRFLYDDDNLYIGAICHESDMSQIIVKELKEDFAGMESDGFGVLLDTLNDKRSGFLFATNPAGAKRDNQSFNDGEIVNTDWDGVWDVRVEHRDDAWTVELVIPFKTLRFSSAENQEWGLNVLRRIRRKNEESFWMPLPRRYRVNRASMTGTLKGLSRIRQGRNLKLKPFAITSAADLRTGPRQGEDYDADGGFDLKYGLTPSLTLDLTYRTEFSQVEVDQQQVNLTRFNLFFPEKREFFLENSGLFNVGQPISLVAPGTVGVVSSPNNLLPFFSRRIGLSSDGTPIPIFGGSRVSGKLGDYDVGFLAMRSEQFETTPATNYLVGRVRRNFMGNSWVGAIGTDRSSTISGDFNRVYGADMRVRAFENLEVTSYLFASETPGRNTDNQARRFETAWVGDDVSVNGVYQEVQPNFNPELGFVRRGNMKNYNSTLSWRPRLEPGHTIRNFNFFGGVDYFTTAAGELETREQEAVFGILFDNSSAISVRGLQTYERLSEPFRIRPGSVIPVGDYEFFDASVTLNTDRSQMISADISFVTGEFWDGRRRAWITAVSFKPDHHFNVDLTFDRNTVRLPSGSFETDLVGVRLLYAFTNRLFLNAFLQYNSDTDQLSSNIRFQFIHHPLSDLFIVFNDRRESGGGQLLERSLVVKLTHLLNF